MSELRVVAERAMGAPAEVIYRCIADFDRHHQHFLPPAFSEFQVEEGRGGCRYRAQPKMTVDGRRSHQDVPDMAYEAHPFGGGTADAWRRPFGLTLILIAMGWIDA